MNRMTRVATCALATALSVPAYAGPPPVPNPIVPRILIEVPADPAPTATFVPVTITIENIGGPGYSELSFGDGSRVFGTRQRDGLCKPVTPGSYERFTTRHAYRRAGTWTVRMTFTPHCQDRDLPPYVGQATVTITPGIQVSNGPERPRVYDVFPATQRGRDVQLSIDLDDYDGFLRTLTYTWGDRTKTTYTYPFSYCEDSPDHWPTVFTSKLPLHTFTPNHRYARAGTYTVTATMTTTGCNGKHAQTASKSTRVTVR